MHFFFLFSCEMNFVYRSPPTASSFKLALGKFCHSSSVDEKPHERVHLQHFSAPSSSSIARARKQHCIFSMHSSNFWCSKKYRYVVCECSSFVTTAGIGNAAEICILLNSYLVSLFHTRFFFLF